MWRILVVDDNFINRKLLIEILRNKATCDIAANGQEALQAYEHAVTTGSPYQLILLDIAMPDVDGIEVLRQIREREKQRGIQIGNGVPVIMVTAFKEPFLEAFNKGCDDYIVKPVVPDVLVQKIKEKLG